MFIVCLLFVNGGGFTYVFVLLINVIGRTPINLNVSLLLAPRLFEPRVCEVVWGVKTCLLYCLPRHLILPALKISSFVRFRPKH